MAQVHKAVLNDNFREVAVKIQFPFLQTQSKIDLFVLRNFTFIANILMRFGWDNHDIDLMKLFNTWTNTLEEELDFEKEIENGKKLK